MKINMNKIVMLLVFTLFISHSSLVNADSYNYQVRFTDSYDYWRASLSQWGSPMIEGGTEVYKELNSKSNQPRSVGSSPHRGADFNMNSTEYIYAPFSGYVSYSEGWKLSLKWTSDTHATFFHVVPYVSKGQYVNKGDRIARIGNSTENGGYAEHLHYGITTDTNFDSYSEKWRPLGVRYKGVSEWNYAMDLDLLSKPYLNSNGELFITCYVWNDTDLQECESVKLWYKPSGSTVSWKYVEMTPSSSYTKNGRTVTNRWKSGSLYDFGFDYVDWYVTGDRDVNDPYNDDFDESKEPHNWGHFPAKYRHSPDNGNNYDSSYPPATETFQGF
jgi:murein DD-endopeptidase MepM/ murein hydrolase activator NlpD